jgi:hypothetical protein
MRFSPATPSAAILAWAETDRAFGASPQVTGMRAV